MQREMPFLESLPKAQWVPDSIVTGWETYREAVLWCWTNRSRNSRNEIGDQAMFARAADMHSPHVCRCVREQSKAPMDLPPDYIAAFEAFTGWRGVSQYLSLQGRLTLMEQVIAQRAAA